jgi:hypothetical protein
MGRIYVEVSLSSVKRPNSYLCYKRGKGVSYKRVEVLNADIPSAAGFSFTKPFKKENHRSVGVQDG